MKELVDIVAVYASLAAGFITLWISLYYGHAVTDSILRALIAGAAFLAFGLFAKVVLVLVFHFSVSSVAKRSPLEEPDGLPVGAAAGSGEEEDEK